MILNKRNDAGRRVPIVFYSGFPKLRVKCNQEHSAVSIPTNLAQCRLLPAECIPFRASKVMSLKRGRP
jgi:hypothetical protein